MNNRQLYASTKRFLAIDILKVLAIAGMIVYHFFYIMNFLGVRDVDMHHGILEILGDAVRLLFLSLVGVTSVLSKRKSQALGEHQVAFVLRRLRQAGYVFVFAIIINLVTYIFVPDQFVKFGVLHMIALGIFCGSLLANRPYLSAQIGLGIILVDTWTTPTSGKSFAGYIIGLSTDNSPSLDYFPIFPWLGVILIGMLAGHWFFQIVTKRTQAESNIDTSKTAKCIRFISSKALWIYITHIPILLLIVYGIKMIMPLF